MEDQDLTARARARIGTVLKDKWTVDRLIGVGGMACVYEATHRNQKRVAIKMLHAELSQNADVRTRFLREGYVANTVGHRGAVAVDDDHVTDDGAAFLVMELLEGETLEARRERKDGRLPADEVLSLMDQLLDVLAAAHDKGVVHRDLKPENLFFTQQGVLKVLDFGIARLRDGSADTAGRGATRTGSVMGTPAFMAPEQARGRWDEVDGRTDLWAVGATMFTLLSGRFVREAGTVNEELALAITAHAVSVATVVPDLPRPVVEVVDRAMAYDKADRWPDAHSMQIAVRLAYHALSGETGGGEDVAAPRAIQPSLADAPGSAAAAGEHPAAAAKTVGATSVSQPATTLPGARSKAGILAVAGVVVAVGIGALALRGGGSGAVPAQVGEAPATAQPTAIQTAAPALTPTSSAPPAVSAPPPADPPASASATPSAEKPSTSASAKAPRVPVFTKPDPFSRRR